MPATHLPATLSPIAEGNRPADKRHGFKPSTPSEAQEPVSEKTQIKFVARVDKKQRE